MAVSENITSFIDEFNKLEDYLRRKGKYSSHDTIASIINKEASRNPIIRQYKDDLDSFRELRNALVHQQGIYTEPFAEPYPATVNRLQKISSTIINPPKASSVAVLNLATISYSDSLVSALAIMEENGYSVLPVIEDGVAKDILSEYSILKWVAREAKADGATLIGEKVSDISEFLDKPTMDDANSSYLFLSRNALLNDITLEFEKALKSGARLNAIFVTEHGKPTERLQGIITAWDIANTTKL